MLRFLLSLTAHLWKFDGYDGLAAAMKWLQADKVGWSNCTCDTPPSHPLHALSVSVCACVSVQEWQAYLCSQGGKVYSRSSQIVMAFTYWPSIVKSRPPGRMYEMRSYNLKVSAL